MNIDHTSLQVEDAISRKNENQAWKQHYDVQQRENDRKIQRFNKRILKNLNKKQQINEYIHRRLYVDYFKAQLNRKFEIKQSIFIENRKSKSRKRNFRCSTSTKKNEIIHQDNILWLFNIRDIMYSLQRR